MHKISHKWEKAMVRKSHIVQMQSALLLLLRQPEYSISNRMTRSLMMRNWINETGSLTQAGEAIAMSLCHIGEQLVRLDIPCDRIIVPKCGSKIELAVLEHYEECGYLGFWDEGSIINQSVRAFGL